MAIKVEVLSTALEPPPFAVIQGRRASLGRGERCDVRIPDPSVSRLHASIVKRGNNYLLIDEGSRFGTGVGSSREPIWLAPDSPRIIEDGEHVWLGQIELRLSLVQTTRGQDPGLAELPQTLVRAGLASVGIEANEERVAATLAELTDLADEESPLPVPEPPARAARLGVADLFDEDRHPPFKTDLFIAALAILVVLGCALLYLHLGI